MKTTATTTATATVKNNSKKTAATAADPKEEKSNRRTAAAKKAAETRRAKKEQEARELAEQAARLKAEEAARQKAEADAMKEDAKKSRREHSQHYSAAIKDARNQSPLYYMHLLNRRATGKAEAGTAADLLWCYEDLQNMTPTAANYKGFSYDAVKVDSRGRICKMVTAPADIEITYYQYGIVRVNTRTASDVDMIDTYQGYMLLIPVQVSEAGILQAAKTVTAMYKDTYQDARNIYRTKTTRHAMKEAAEKRQHNAMKAAAEKTEREQMKTAARTARETAEAAPTVELQPVRRSWWRNIAASLF